MVEKVEIDILWRVLHCRTKLKKKKIKDVKDEASYHNDGSMSKKILDFFKDLYFLIFCPRRGAEDQT